MSQIVPTDEQQVILDLGLTTIKVRAGAGTGKTTTVAMVIANLIATHGVEPEQVLGITFTNKAASELADRVRAMVGSDEPGRQAEVHTYHGFAAQILAELGALAGVDNRAKVITPTFARQLMSETFHHRSYQHLDITQSRTLDQIRRLGERLGDHLLTAQDIVDLPAADDIERARHEMAQTLVQYQEDKRRLKVVDYSDLVTLSTRIVTENPDLARAIRDRYRVVVLDEYQDTNPAQRGLLLAIFGDGFPVIAVGDEDQTIYEWRGASAENFELFTDHFRRPDGGPAHLKGLRLNRRSTQRILEVANQVRARAGVDPELLISDKPDDDDSEVVTHWAADALEEAEWIAARFEGLHDRGVPWREMAVLFRKNKDFAVMVDVLGRHEIPLEVANIGGLLSVPEVADLRAWLTALERPEDSTALTHILFGSRYRLGLADLAPLARLAGAENRGDEDEEEATPVTLIEAIESLDELPSLRGEARLALDGFLEAYRRVLLESQGLALVDVCRLILDQTGAWRDIEALPVNRRLTARLNLYRFLDLTEDWSPLKGRPSIQAFLEYLDAMEEEPAEELDSARLSGEDAVTLVTVHRAKGLEWENVAVPAVTKAGFPSGPGTFPNPATVADQVPVGLRIDSVLDQLPGDIQRAKDFLRERHLRQEWRVAYVAVTRAKRRLFLSGAHWYGHPEANRKPKEPSDLWLLVDGLEVSTNAGVAVVGERPDVLRLRHEDPTPDPLFPDGWDGALRRALDDPGTISALARQLGLEQEHQVLADEMQTRLFSLADPAKPSMGPETDTVSVTGLVTYAQCPKRFYWTSVDPLPRRRNLAAVRGTEVHRRIELHQRGQVPLDLVDDELYDVIETDTDSGGAGAFANYMSSRFADARAIMVETPFTIGLASGIRANGRIDAIYQEQGRWEVVDFKSGRRRDEPSRIVQLQAYAVAVDEFDFGFTKPEEVIVTFAYLGGGGEEVSHVANASWLDDARRSLESLATGIGGKQFTERTGEWCNGCDFLRFCGPGQERVG